MDDTRNTVREVREMLEKALEDREVFVHLNGEAPGVSLPATLAGNPNVTLKLSYYYRGPLVVGDEQVEADLLFPEGSFTCRVPLKHIWGITQTSGESMFWPEHAPRQVLEEMIRGVSSEDEEQGADSTSDQPQTGRTKLQAVPKTAQSSEDEGHETPEDGETSQKSAGDDDPKKKKAPVLKRIK